VAPDTCKEFVTAHNESNESAELKSLPATLCDLG